LRPFTAGRSLHRSGCHAQNDAEATEATDQFSHRIALIADGNRIFRHACGLGLEGIISKRIGSRYVSGRTRAWLKTKNPAFRAAVSGVLWIVILCFDRAEQLRRKRGYRCLSRPGYRMGDVDSRAFEAVPREFAVKTERSAEMTPKALLTKSLRRIRS
jgi:hypothetical protein